MSPRGELDFAENFFLVLEELSAASLDVGEKA